MILLQKICKLLLTISLVLLVSTSIGLDLASGESLAATPLSDLISQPPIQIATMDRAKAGFKNIEGQNQEAIGNITGDRKDQIVGRAKQGESRVRQSIEDMKSKLNLSGRAKAVSKKIEGKNQEAAGKAKQVEGQFRNTIEDVKGNIQSILN
ncbi:CsbD family protein [Anabaena cylindrica FACHB-243]|uniref:CsbD-like protein n=1 Tax=Anabaena cylindrica (strain ATCC 27899 / PCC 7122) TaxID=272123 RepID=K9ZM72_ANACC|nr:CsbD family protein [Anabaena sp. CCAP 1446/1C]AFZ59647.1 CsbD-like protein [Anabaena cylindrica PCC 7122]MBD2418691.1 CsbD family protein [Anabaena cylindrica FACHB-243]BAY03307.1 CsbD-like protein [Anabaena cylindrica PCC 7122]